MKYFIKSVLGFVVLFIPVLFMYIFIWGISMPRIINPFKVIGGFTNTRLQEIKEFKNVDILFLGASRTYRHFDTRIFRNYGFNSFNLGTSSQTPLQTKILLNRNLEALNPKLIIIEVTPHIFSSDGVESSLDIIANDRIDMETIKMSFSINHIKVYSSLIYALMRDAFRLNIDFHESLKEGIDTYIPGGYVEREVRFWGGKDDLQNMMLSPNNKQINALNEIVYLLKTREMNYILVYSPTTHAEYNSYNNMDEFSSLMETNGDYYDFNKMLNMDDSLHFYDVHHMNQNGVDVFNEELIKIISDNSLIKSYKF